MKLDVTERCSGTLQPIRGVVLGMCLGCARYTMGPSSMSGIAYLSREGPHAGSWACDERRSMGVAHDPQDAPAQTVGIDGNVGGACVTDRTDGGAA
jgi:hypothetical protein